jgi:hypothetical protein
MKLTKCDLCGTLLTASEINLGRRIPNSIKDFTGPQSTITVTVRGSLDYPAAKDMCLTCKYKCMAKTIGPHLKPNIP